MRIIDSNVTYTEALADKTSEKYKQLANQIVAAVGILWTSATTIFYYQ